ncbi:MAG: FMN-binding protein [Planctomycetales bacterium]|nr:FMN-binding protein [Planctomycetales bacterium]
MSRNSKFAGNLYVVHSIRWIVFALILGLIHWQADRLKERAASDLGRVSLSDAQFVFPSARAIESRSDADGRQSVLDGAGQSLGSVLQTSPDADHILGFSGPTNLLIAFDPHGHIIQIHVLASGDTRDHVRRVVESPEYWRSFVGTTADAVRSAQPVDAVAGATLTSLAIQAAIQHRLGNESNSLRFSEPLRLSDVGALFPHAIGILQDAREPSLWYVEGEADNRLGSVLRTSPAADNVVGYQGPTDTLVAFDPTGHVIGIVVGHSYDNEPYVTYVREDRFFRDMFKNKTVDQIAAGDSRSLEVEGVSGATMTSQAIAEGIRLAAAKHRDHIASRRVGGTPLLRWRDLGTIGVVIAGLAVGLTRLRGNRWLRGVFQVALIGYLGLTNGDLISQALLEGWAKHGIPWSSAVGLVVLSAAAFMVPLVSKRNVYCSHLCPHGAVQQLVRRRLPWQLHLRPKYARWLRVIPGVLLAWCVVVAMTAVPFSLVDIEPFDAWVFRVAGPATLGIAAIGLIASLFVPMGYCRYGCPTGSLLDYLRMHRASDRWRLRDWTAIGLLALAGMLFWIR